MLKNIGHVVAILIIVVLCSMSLSTMADGLSSKGKVREPLVAGFTPVHKNVFSFQTQKVDVVAMIVRERERIQERKIAKQLEAKVAEVQTQRVIVSREHLVKLGALSIPRSCATLHTHDRAICLRNASLKRDATTFKVASK